MSNREAIDILNNIIRFLYKYGFPLEADKLDEVRQFLSKDL
jgi:hypothetical protein